MSNVPTPAYQLQGNCLTLQCHIQPNAAANEICGLHNGRLKIRIQAPSHNNNANGCLIGFLSKTLRCPKRAIEIHSGSKNRKKTIKINGLVDIPAFLDELHHKNC